MCQCEGFIVGRPAEAITLQQGDQRVLADCLIDVIQGSTGGRPHVRAPVVSACREQEVRRQAVIEPDERLTDENALVDACVLKHALECVGRTLVANLPESNDRGSADNRTAIPSDIAERTGKRFTDGHEDLGQRRTGTTRQQVRPALFRWAEWTTDRRNWRE